MASTAVKDPSWSGSEAQLWRKTPHRPYRAATRIPSSYARARISGSGSPPHQRSIPSVYGVVYGVGSLFFTSFGLLLGGLLLGGLAFTF